MPERDGYIPGVPCWIDTNQPDPEAALPLLPRPVRLGVRGRDARRIRGRATSSAASAAATWPRSDRCPRARRRWPCGTPTSGSTAPTRRRRRSRDAGGAVVAEPFDVHGRGADGGAQPTPRARCSACGRRRTHKGAKVVNEHGSLNFNGLATRDPKRAQGVLRRGVRLADAGACPPATMWTLPGYGDHLEEPTARAFASRWRRWARPTASSTSSPRSTRSPTATPQRRRTGASRSASTTPNATAAKARELGGEVVGGPVDAPWTRMAVIKDPQGATFIASQFVPENKDLVA